MGPEVLVTHNSARRTMSGEWLALVESDGRAYLLQRGSGEVRVRGLGRFNVDDTLGDVVPGDSLVIGQKTL